MASIISAEEAAKQINDFSCVLVNGFVGCGHPEAITSALERRFVAEGHPQSLTLVYSAGQGDRKGLGMDHFAHPGFVKRVIGGHWSWAPALGKMALASQIEAYNLPQGSLTQLFRAMAAGQPGVITSTGVMTFVDPRIEGGKINPITQEDLVELITLDGHEYLRYKPFPCDAALIRGTCADEYGNLSIEEEAVKLETLSMAQAVKRSGGKVFAQVKKISKKPIPPRNVYVPGIYVDYLVVAEEEEHKQTYGTVYDPVFAGKSRRKTGDFENLPLDWRRVIAARAYAELPENAIVNLGIGIPEGVAAIAQEFGRADRLTLTVESGGIGGVPAGGLDFGAVSNAKAFVEHTQQFDFYDGGGLDVACLGFAQASANANINVSKFNGRFAGCGGFIDITQNSPVVIFCGSFTTGGLNVEIADGKMKIISEGRIKKFVRNVEQITFSGEYASAHGAVVKIITERAVFELINARLVLTEIAPGIDLEKDILNNMEFVPAISPSIRFMRPELFLPGAGGSRS